MLCFAAITNNSEISGFITTEVSLSVYKSLSNSIHLVYGSAPFILSPRAKAEEVALIRNNVDVIKKGKKGDRLFNSFSNTGLLCSCSTVKKQNKTKQETMAKTDVNGMMSISSDGKACRRGSKYFK